VTYVDINASDKSSIEEEEGNGEDEMDDNAGARKMTTLVERRKGLNGLRWTEHRLR